MAAATTAAAIDGYIVELAVRDDDGAEDVEEEAVVEEEEVGDVAG